MSQPFYEKAGGLRFACTRCGNCCVRPGPVFFTGGDLQRAAAHLGVTPAAFRRAHGVTLIDGAEAIPGRDDRPCVFYDPATGCTIYEGRPTQCRTWPFWPEVVTRARSWHKAARDCPGMNQGPLHTPEDVRESLDDCDTAGLPEGEPW